MRRVQVTLTRVQGSACLQGSKEGTAIGIAMDTRDERGRRQRKERNWKREE